ncbi:HLA class II histocompatibility antigen, DR alpha chain-like isoform X2 [Sphaerodactylus townsendi]|uniref:HLA class II histocompatibility antigen, DR alpha chain-like isoform X2 n=1 Tax=Sphaerodactylus townsendi TaxID=933632 RepID=UPI00202719D8|nr:HLA class II histocompatibility antigen, DR alpha chain-like isoform X2 [Sphaerodactylus townsendi]
MGGLAGFLGGLLLLLPSLGVPAEKMLAQFTFVQRGLGPEGGPGEDAYDVDREEQFHVDPERREVVWRLPEFEHLASFPVASTLADMAVMRTNLDILMRRSNYPPAQNVPPQVTVYPKNPVALGEPNWLICVADSFSPPVINLTWVKNGQEVKAADETDFFPNTDQSFRRFSYLTFVPNAEDIYYCRVEHWGLAQPLTKEWNADSAEPLPETKANVLCGLGLVVGITGIIVGIVFIMKNRRLNAANVRRRPM